MFNQVSTSDFGIGDYVLNGQQKVRIVGVDLLASKRQVAWKEFSEATETKRWVSVEALRPITPPDAPAYAPAVIATKEIDLAQERDTADQAHEIAKHHIETLEARIASLTRDYDMKLKAQLDISNALLRDLKQAQQQPVMAATGRRKIETRTEHTLSDGRIAGFINEGWVVVFETVIVTMSSGDYGPVSEETHIIRFERELQPAAPPPLDTRTAVETPQPDAAEHDDDAPVTVVDDPAWKSEADPAKPDHMTYAACNAQASSTDREGRVWRVGDPLPDELPTMIRVGAFTIDPLKMPYAATILMHGKEALDAALNAKVKAVFVAAGTAWQAAQPTFTPPRTLGGLSSGTDS